MQKINGLPKSVAIDVDYTFLRIENHEVQNHDGILPWAFSVLNWEIWDRVLPQMIRQGFKYDGFVGELISDLKDKKKFIRILYLYDVAYSRRPDEDRIKYHNSTQMRNSMEAFIKKISSCKNWEQFYHVMKKGSDFQKMMKTRITKEVENCIK